MPMRKYCFAMLAVCATVATAAAAPASDLLANQAAWSSWAPRTEIEPEFSRESAGGSLAGLVVAGGGNANACGCWQRTLPPLAKGRSYRLEASFQAEGVDEPAHSIWALAFRGRSEYQELDYVDSRDGWHRMAAEIRPEENFNDMKLGLFLAWSAAGQVRWKDVRIEAIEPATKTERIVRLAAVSGRPKAPESLDDCLDFYCASLDQAARQGAQLVVLPEVINADRLRDDGSSPSETIPGPTSRRLAAKARQHGIYVAASIVEREAAALFNTGMLIDPAGQVIGKYRKTHLTIGEGLLSGKRPGDDYPVFDTPLGRIGYMICFDNHYPEVARTLAVKGAEIIVFSNMADGREEGTLWEPYMQTRALDNQVHIAASVNFGRSLIVGPRGEILARTDKTPGSVAIADCRLDQSARNSTGREIGKRYLRVRRAETFAPLLDEYWQSKGYPAQPR